MGSPEGSVRELIIRRASEIEVAAEDLTNSPDLEEVGREAGISPAAFRAALREREESRKVGRLGPFELSGGAVVLRHVAAAAGEDLTVSFVTGLQDHTGEAGRLHVDQGELHWISQRGTRVFLISLEDTTCFVASKVERTKGLSTALGMVTVGALIGFTLGAPTIGTNPTLATLVGAGLGIGTWWVGWRSHVRNVRDRLDGTLDAVISRVFQRPRSPD